MKKLLLIGIMIVFGMQTFAFSPKISTGSNTTYIVPANLNGMTAQEFLKLTPKKYQELTGRKMTFKQKLSFAIIKAKLKKQLADEKPAARKTDLGLLSLLFGGAAYLVALIPGVGFASIAFAIAAVVLGILGLGRKKGDTKSIIGLVLGATFLLVIAIAAATFAAFY